MKIDRVAIALMAKKPALEWINNVDSKDIKHYSLSDINSDRVLHLLPIDVNTEELAESWAVENAKFLLEEYMDLWFTDMSRWPSNRDSGLFTDWFDVDYHSLIIDIVDSPINKVEAV